MKALDPSMPTSFISMKPESENCTRGNPPRFTSAGNRSSVKLTAPWELIDWFPELKATLEIVHVGIDHPRPAISALLGEGRHNAPTLVLHAGSKRVRGLAYAEANGHAYLASARLIARHFAGIYGTPSPRGG